MDFQSERTALTILSETIIKGGASLYNAIKYTYSLADEDFYNCDVKDILKVVLNNLTSPNALQSMGLRMSNERCEEMNSPAYNRVLPLIVHSFAVRIPALRRASVRGETMDDNQLRALYELIVSKGGDNIDGVIEEDYNTNRKLIRSGRELPPYTADWYKAYVYTKVPALAEVTNKNMFLLGFVDVLFTLFHACLEEELARQITEFSR